MAQLAAPTMRTTSAIVTTNADAKPHCRAITPPITGPISDPADAQSARVLNASARFPGVVAVATWVSVAMTRAMLDTPIRPRAAATDHSVRPANNITSANVYVT